MLTSLLCSLLDDSLLQRGAIDVVRTTDHSLTGPATLDYQTFWFWTFLIFFQRVLGFSPSNKKKNKKITRTATNHKENTIKNHTKSKNKKKNRKQQKPTTTHQTTKQKQQPPNRYINKTQKKSKKIVRFFHRTGGRFGGVSCAF